MRGESREPGTSYRPLANGTAVRSKEELRRLLSLTLRALFKNLLHAEFHLATGNWDPAGSMSHTVRGLTGFDGPGLPFLKDVSADHDFVPARHAVRRDRRMSAPLLEGRVVLGLIEVEAVPGKPFTAVDLQILESIAGVFSLALQRLRSREYERQRASIETDRRAAGSVQRRLMNGTLPTEAGVKVDAHYLPALDVGGDFYDLTHLGEGRVGGAIGDVSGKGVSAALIMSRVSADMGRAIRTGTGPSKVLETVNATLTDMDSETFVTASCIRLDARQPSLTVSSAGHLPLLVRRAGGEVFDFGRASGTPLGMLPCQYADERIELRQRDIVILMTDGLAEALDRPGASQGATRLHQIVNGAPHDPRIVNERILTAAHEMKGAEALDDVTLVALQIESR
jgi:sigma-B regulation protein RsbU (phosphoserine phosphatase)